MFSEGRNFWNAQIVFTDSRKLILNYYIFTALFHVHVLLDCFIKRICPCISLCHPHNPRMNAIIRCWVGFNRSTTTRVLDCSENYYEPTQGPVREMLKLLASAQELNTYTSQCLVFETIFHVLHDSSVIVCNFILLWVTHVNVIPLCKNLL